MDNKMVRFLGSIGIEDINDYDLEFLSIQKDKEEPNKFDYFIIKDTPWTYSGYQKFLSHLEKIQYKYRIFYTYKTNYTKEELHSFIDDFIFNECFEQFHYEIELKGSEIKILFKDDSEFECFSNLFTRNLHEDLESLFNELGLSYKITVLNLNAVEKVQESKSELKKREEEHKEKIKDTQIKIVNEEKEAKEQKHQMLERRRIYRLASDYKETTLEELSASDDAVAFSGKLIINGDPKDKNDGERSYQLTVGNFKAAINCFLTTNSKNLPQEEVNKIKTGNNVKVKGRIGSNARGIYMQVHYIEILPNDPLRDDNAPEKRVELHLHSKMSEMDAVSSISEYAELASHMGHKAIAITDHGVAQAFPEAQSAAKKYNIKMLYGSELYLIDDYLVGCINPDSRKLKDLPLVVLDLESTGLQVGYDKITEIGAVKIKNGMTIETFDELVNPEMHIPDLIQEKTKITDEMVSKCRTIEEVLPDFLKWCGEDTCLVAHNAQFDFYMLNEEYMKLYGKEMPHSCIDTLPIDRYVNPANRAHSLGAMCKRYKIDYDAEEAHRADYDAKVLAACMENVITALEEENKDVDLNYISKLPYPKEALKYLRPKHVTAICKNQAGLKDLYKIISISHCEYVGSLPLTPRSVLDKHRSNLILGSACFNGEVFQAATRSNMKKLEQAISYYDFIEIQPLSCYSYLLNMNELPNEESLLRNLRKIIDTSEKLGKMICATGDCHYCNPEEKIFRDIMIASEAVGKIRHPLNEYGRTRLKEKAGHNFPNPDQGFLSTQEMLDTFKWYGDEEKTYKWVVTNTNYIADQTEVIIPIPPNKLFTPTIDNCENMLKDLCYSKAHEIYGEKLPQLIEDRLDTELKGIIGNGYSVIYYISHKLVKLTNDNGYIVGSRGSVGSSFVAFCSGITEINALPPHYHCPKCKHVEFHDYKEDGITSGFDLPDKNCPECGELMIKDGQNIPFQTFLGFAAEKVPDIDLNFPADYQSTAHLFTRDLLGEDKVFRAGTISTLQDKTAFGNVSKQYFNEFLGEDSSKYSSAYIGFLAAGCVGCKRTTGQHPGGIVVVPREYEVYDFTPIQYPANDTSATWRTTHFDFHSIHDTILKFDMLGHVDPQALKMMQDLTNEHFKDAHIDVSKIKVDDPKILSLFINNDALNLKHKYIKQDIATTGLPEMGTDFVKQLIREAKPRTFKDLFIISGLSHGTNVWTNNAQDLIKQGITDINGVIGCRDDIMTYLISMGLDNSKAFTIMETVRKGKKLSDEQIKDMEDHGVPEYYINSCKKIKYLFPKGHACAYVIMALRVAYFKIYYPLSYYATYFTLRCDQYDLETMVKGIDAIHDKLMEYKARKESNNPEKALSNKEESIQDTLVSCLEFAERGFTFTNIDINRSDASNFVIDYENNALIPPFKVLDGLGELGVKDFIEERKKKPFETIEDFKKRGKIPDKVIKYLKANGALKNLRENDDITLFDLSAF